MKEEKLDVISCPTERSSSWTKLFRVIALILRLGYAAGPLDCEEIKDAKLAILKSAQSEIKDKLLIALKSGKGRFRKVAPLQDAKGVWRVGSIISGCVPFKLDSEMPSIFPNRH